MEFLPFYFFLSLLIGFFIVYICYPVPKIIIKYPNPNTANNILYIDDNNVCYKYRTEKIKCPEMFNNDISKLNPNGFPENPNKQKIKYE